MSLIKNSDDETPKWLSNAIKDRMKNASRVPKIYYGLHFAEGVAEYREEGKAPYRVFINESTAKRMDPTFEGRPVVVLHTDEELKEMLPKIMDVADGFVIESFFNKADGKHWTKFLAITDRAHEAISKKWSLSNCYKIKSRGQGGMWHGVDFQNEVLDGTYEHLALVPNPRYESMILTPEEFKAYNSEKEIELERLANSNNEGDRSMKVLNFFKKQKVEKLDNGADVANLMVTLEKSKVDVTVAEAVAMADELKVKNMQGYCNGDHMVKVGEEEMSVNELVKRHMENEAGKKKADEEAAEGEGADKDDAFTNDEADDDAEEDAALDNESDEEEEAPPAKESAKDKAARLKNEIAKKKKQLGRHHFDSLSNAADLAALRKEKQEEFADTERSQLERGANRYGSAKK